MPIAEIAYGAFLTVNGLTLVVLGAVLRGQLAIAMPAFGAAILLHGLGTGPPAGCEGCVEHEQLEAVGGDFYDFLHRDQPHFAGVIADATGHGVQAALATTMIRGTVASRVELAHDPARVLREINADLMNELGARLVSVAYAYVNLDAGTMRIGNAGHPPVIVHSPANGRTTQYGARQAAIGASADEDYENTEIPVVPGDRIALYSDGLAEADNAGAGPFGTTRIASALLETAHLDCRSAAKRIVGRARGWATAGFHDDVTLMLIDIPPKPAQPASTESP